MRFPFLCILIASLMPFLFSALAKLGGQLSGKKFNNHDPRTYLAQLTGWPYRAQAAQQNSWEALPLFIAGVLMATYAGVAAETINLWSAVFIVARVIYGGCYLLDIATLRSMVWLVATYSSLHLMTIAI